MQHDERLVADRSEFRVDLRKQLVQPVDQRIAVGLVGGGVVGIGLGQRLDDLVGHQHGVFGIEPYVKVDVATLVVVAVSMTVVVVVAIVVVVRILVVAVAGLRPERTRLIFGLLMATVIAVAIKIVGILLIVALLVIPAATARRCAVNPEQMAALAGAAGVLSIAGGLFASARLDTPSGPSIVVAGLLLFAVTRFRRSSQRTRS